MFGYIKPQKSELLVRQSELYRALYCGLCDTISSRVSPALSLSLSYDFVFLVIVRALAEDFQFSARPKRCIAHPTKKRSMVIPCEPLEYCAKSALILTYAKLDDDIRDPDRGFFKKLIIRLYRVILSRDLKRLLKKEPEFKELYGFVSDRLDKIAALEKESSSDLDGFCKLFGELMGEICSFGFEGNNRLICQSIGDLVGKYIYTLDACDDLERDEKKHCFNPLLKKYSSSERAIEEFEQVDMVLGMYCAQMDAALGLFESRKDYINIAYNVVRLGMGAQARRILIEKRKK